MHSESEVVACIDQKRGGMAQSVGHLGRNFKPMRGGMAQSVDRSVHFFTKNPQTPMK